MPGVDARCSRTSTSSSEPGEDFAERFSDEIVVGVELERESEILIGAVRIAEVRVEGRELEQHRDGCRSATHIRDSFEVLDEGLVIAVVPREIRESRDDLAVVGVE